MDDTFEQHVQRKAERHLDDCMEAMYALEEDPTANVSDPAYGPFCGCDTCVVREVLSICWDEMLIEARREVAAEAQKRHVEVHGARDENASLPEPRTPAQISGDEEAKLREQF